MEENKNDKMVIHIASFVLGIISILTTLFWYMVLPTGILAIVFGAKSVRKTGSKLGKAGLILGIISISIAAVIYIGCTIVLIAGNM